MTMADPLLSPTSTAPSSINLVAAAGSLEERLSHLLNSNTQFSVAAYLNLALGTSGSQGHLSSPFPADTNAESLQARMAELALQLQLQTQSCHDDIGRIGAELQAILPRCAADVGRVGVGLEGMRLDAQALLEQTARGAEEQELSSSLETLTTLHALRSNLSQTKEVLTAAATWDSTMNSIPPLLAQQNLSEAVNALRQLENGERALRGMPNREERQLAIDKVRQQVQVLLQPQLKHALQNMSTRLAPLQQCVALYEKLDKMDALRDEYVKTRPGALHKAWFDFSPSFSLEPSMDDSNATTKSDLETWLPNWYDMVLQLLTEERRQSATVFGAEAAPEIVVKVLRECFRPILPSFQSRLETVFSSNPAMTSKGSFESICAVYESTLRFLSLAYELVAGAFLDLAEAGMAHKGDTGVGLYTEMIAVMATVSSPFANYQQRFDQLESKHLQLGTSELAKSMQQTVSSIATGRITAFDALQQAVDRLKDIAPCVFPSTESSLVRFELLSGGYRVGPALAMIDKILASHVGEVTIAVKTFSAALNSEHSPLVDGFDEQHVLCAMEVLKLAGNFRRDLRTFEDKTRDKLSLLSDRIANYILQETEVEKAASGKHGSVGSSFSLPDSLSVVEIDSILTKLVCGSSGEDGGEDADESSPTNTDDINPALELLNRLAVAAKDDRGSLLYPEAEDAIQRLAQSCHGCVLDVCSAIPRKHLSTMSEMASWKGASSDAFDSYGTLPQAYITQVGEHMLALVQAFEPFAADQEALSIANEVMDGVTDVALQSWEEFAASAGIIGSQSTVEVLMHGIEIGHLVLSNSALSAEDAELEEGTSEAERASALFCNAWLDVVGLAVTGRLLERVMRIPQLTQKGCEHLNADLNYLVNVFSALGVAGHPHPLVTHLAELAMLSDDDLKSHIVARHRDNSGEGALRSVEARVALLRGVSLN